MLAARVKHVVSCHSVACQDMLRHATPCHAMPSHAVPCGHQPVCIAHGEQHGGEVTLRESWGTDKRMLV